MLSTRIPLSILVLRTVFPLVITNGRIGLAFLIYGIWSSSSIFNPADVPKRVSSGHFITLKDLLLITLDTLQC